MSFCINCGQELVENAKFCSNCGKAVEDTNLEQQRKSVYDGEIHKCPNCGDTIDAYETVCEACGFEIRGRKTTSIVHELALKLEKIDDIQKKEELIRNFYIPNTKEDIYEFMILANSNIGNNSKNESAWIAKFEQAYQKSRIAFKTTQEISEIKKDFERKIKHKKIEYIFKNKKNLITIVIAFAFLVIITLGINYYHSSQIDIQNEIDRLNAICKEIELAIENKEYTKAKSKSNLLVFSVHNMFSKQYEEDWYWKSTEYAIAIEEAKTIDKENNINN